MCRIPGISLHISMFLTGQMHSFIRCSGNFLVASTKNTGDVYVNRISACLGNTSRGPSSRSVNITLGQCMKWGIALDWLNDHGQKIIINYVVSFSFCKMEVFM